MYIKYYEIGRKCSTGEGDKRGRGKGQKGKVKKVRKEGKNGNNAYVNGERGGIEGRVEEREKESSYISIEINSLR